MARLTTTLGFLATAAACVSAAPTEHHAQPKRIKSNNYAGVVNYGEEIVGASVDITIPECSVGTPDTYYSAYSTDAWVGISAYPNPPNATNLSYGLLQTGITCLIVRDYNVTANTFTTVTQYQVWTEWAPAGPMYFNTTDDDLRVGDKIHGRVRAHGRNEGSTYLKNYRTGKEYTYEFTNQTDLLFSTNAEWITECETGFDDGEADGQLTASFLPWRFENAEYLTTDGKKHAAGPNDLIDTYINGTKVAETEYLGAGKLQVKDTWPANLTLGIQPQPTDPN